MYKDRPILLLALGETLTWATLFYVFPALLLRWEQALGWSKADLTAAIAMAVLISGLVSPLTGRIIDAGRGPALMAISAICGGLGLLALAWVTALWQFYAVWAWIGMSLAGSLYEPCFALVTRARGAQAKRGIVAITLFAGFASTISFPAAHALAEAAGWRVTVGIFGATAILAAAPLLWFGARSLQRVAGIHGRPAATGPGARADVLRRPAFWCLAGGFACGALVQGATLQHFLSILAERGIPAETAVLAASFIGPMQVAGRLAMMMSERVTSHHGVTLAAFSTLGLSVLLLLISGTSPVFLSGFIILFGGAWGTVSILRPLVARDILGGQNFGAKSGALALIFLVGSASAPYLGSLIWSTGGYDAMLIVLVLVAAAGGGLYALAHRLAAAQSIVDAPVGPEPQDRR